MHWPEAGRTPDAAAGIQAGPGVPADHPGQGRVHYPDGRHTQGEPQD